MLICINDKPQLITTKLTVVDEGCRAQPELSAAFARGVHHAEVVDSGPQHGAVGRTQLRDAAQQDLHPLPCKPATQRPT